MWQMFKKEHLLPDVRIVQVLVAKDFVLCLCFSYSQHAIQWCTSHPTGKLGLASWGSCMMYWEREVQCFVWWLFAPSSWEAYSKKLGFDLPRTYSLFSGNRISTFFWEKILPSLLVPITTSPLQSKCVTGACSISVCSLLVRMVMWLTLGQWIQFWEICWNYWRRQVLGLGHCEDVDL